MGSSYVPVSDETVEELKAQSLLPVERFLDLSIDRVGYSSYLKDQIRTELKSSGDPVTQITVLQGAIRELYRLLKQAPSFVLGSKISSTYPEGTPPVFSRLRPR